MSKTHKHMSGAELLAKAMGTKPLQSFIKNKKLPIIKKTKNSSKLKGLH